MMHTDSDTIDTLKSNRFIQHPVSDRFYGDNPNAMNTLVIAIEIHFGLKDIRQSLQVNMLMSTTLCS